MSLRTMLEEKKVGSCCEIRGFCVTVQGGIWGHLLSFIQPEEEGGVFRVKCSKIRERTAEIG